MGSHVEAVPPQQAPSAPITRRAACAYLSFTTCLMSWSAMARSSGAAAGGVFGERQARGDLRRRRRDVVLQVVVEMVDLPLDPVRILDPELVLVGVAAVHAHLLLHRQPGRLHSAQQLHHEGRRVHLYTDVIDRADYSGLPT